MPYERTKDPTQLPVQINTTVPWQLREDLNTIARDSNVSFAQMVRDALMKQYKHELTLLSRERTRGAGATS